MKKWLFLLLISAVAQGAQEAKEPSEVALSRLKYGGQALKVGQFETSVTKKLKLTPDTVEFSVTHVSEGLTPEEASEQNREKMGEFRSFLATLGVGEKDVTTLGFDNYQSSRYRENRDEKEIFETRVGVNFRLEGKKFYDALKLLKASGIENAKKNRNYEFYEFNITKRGESKDETALEAEKVFKQLEAGLEKLGALNLEISEFETKKLSKNGKNIKIYNIRDTIKIKTKNFTILGKILQKANLLNMNLNGDMFYTVSDEQVASLLAANEALLLDEAAQKARRILGKDYVLGVVTHINYRSDDLTGVKFRANGQVQQNRVMAKMSLANAAVSDDFVESVPQINTPEEFELNVWLNVNFEITKRLF